MTEAHDAAGHGPNIKAYLVVGIAVAIFTALSFGFNYLAHNDQMSVVSAVVGILAPTRLGWRAFSSPAAARCVRKWPRPCIAFRTRCARLGIPTSYWSASASTRKMTRGKFYRRTPRVTAPTRAVGCS